ncbi:type IV pilus assembly protein PilM [soil metagenome]
MGSINKTPYFFQSKPLFGLDIGKGSLKIVQLQLEDTNRPKLVAYGSTTFDHSAIEDGVITDPAAIAKAAQTLFKDGLIGDITSRRIALTIPSYRTFTRSLKLPLLKPKELAEAVRLEAEQYIPLSLDELYLDYTTISTSDDGVEVLVVAVPKGIVDSYLELGTVMGLETMLIESTMSANGRLFGHDKQSDVASVIIDFGTLSADVSIYDHGIVTTGTVEGGGQIFTQAIEKALNVSNAEANIIKTKYGLGKSRRQDEIHTALEPILHKIVTEIKRLQRYHHERYGSGRQIQQVVALGGGANMPGLSDYFTNNLRIAVRAIDPWQCVDMNNLQPPSAQDRSMYTSAIGAALTPAHEVFK